MIDAVLALFNDPKIPSLHVLVVHFPIAFLFLAPVFDIGCIFFRQRVWLDRAATSLYIMGTIGAGAAYLSGERASEMIAEISPVAESALADHENMAVLTLIALAVVSLVRLMVSWLAREDRRIHLGIFRLIALPIALVGLALLALTADAGGNLVYRHGVGVQQGNEVSNPR